MAIDEALFIEAAKGSTPPTLRIYGWLRPAISLGRFQQVEREVDLDYCRQEHIEVVPRPTGGKAVYHENDLTYALICGPGGHSFPESIPETYALISHALATGLSEIGIPVSFGSVSKSSKHAMTAFCFSSCAPAELAVAGRKILGSAQVRGRKTFLQHGSLLITCEVERIYDCFLPHLEPRTQAIEKLKASITSVSEWLKVDFSSIHEKIANAWKMAFSKYFNVSFKEGFLLREEEKTANRLLEEKYRPWQKRFLLS
ncbi:MAG: lipoate--protein ligase family protein [Syntrophales bacterium]|nr:lipoate--protein ligase family protein [Syntrophales bacterium]